MIESYQRAMPLVRGGEREPAGLYQVNIRIPESAPAGDEVPLRLSVPNGRNDSVLIAIRP